MNARLLLILLAVTVALAFTQRYRKLGMALSGVLIVLIVWFNVLGPEQRPTQQQSSAAHTATSAAPPTARLDDVKLSGNGAPWQLTGTIQNTADLAITAIQIQIQRWDCPAVDAPMTECALLWQGLHTLRLKIAPQARSKFDERFYIHESVASAKSQLRDQFHIKSIN